jgi:cytochrome c peroxidase
MFRKIMRVEKLLSVATCVLAGSLTLTLAAQGPSLLSGPKAAPNGRHFPNPDGTSCTISTSGDVDLTGPFFQSLGTNGRSCATCHQPGDGMSLSSAHIQERFDASQGREPLFRLNDGANCDHGLDVSTQSARSDAYSLLRTRGLIRVAIDVPAVRDFDIVEVHNPYGCGETTTISQYRRPLPSTNLRFLSAVMWDGRESSGANKITYANYSTQLIKNLLQQSLDATNGHAQGAGLHPTLAQKQQIVDFEMALTTAQTTSRSAGNLSAQGATGGPEALLSELFFISINSQVNQLNPDLEQPGGRTTPTGHPPQGDGVFDSGIFDLFDAWKYLPAKDARAAIARGQTLFNFTPIALTDVVGLNDPLSMGGILEGGASSFTGTCGTCHDTPNVGNHSFATPLNIGVGDPMTEGATVSKGGLDISYLPTIKACRQSDPTVCVTTTDLGQALIDGKFDHIGKLKGPVLRGLASRAPYFHNGSAKTLLDVVRFYEVRFGLMFTPQQESDLVAFLSSL